MAATRRQPRGAAAAPDALPHGARRRLARSRRARACSRSAAAKATRLRRSRTRWAAGRVVAVDLADPSTARPSRSATRHGTCRAAPRQPDQVPLRVRRARPRERVSRRRVRRDRARALHLVLRVARPAARDAPPDPADWAPRLYLSEWDLEPRSVDQTAHLLAVLIQGQIEAFKTESSANVRTPYARAALVRCSTKRAGGSRRRTCSTRPTGRRRWEIDACLGEALPEVAALAVPERLRTLLASQGDVLRRMAARDGTSRSRPTRSSPNERPLQCHSRAYIIRAYDLRIQLLAQRGGRRRTPGRSGRSTRISRRWPLWDADIVAVTRDGPFATGTTGSLDLPRAGTAPLPARRGAGASVLHRRVPVGELTVGCRTRIEPLSSGSLRLTYTAEIEGPVDQAQGSRADDHGRLPPRRCARWSSWRRSDPHRRPPPRSAHEAPGGAPGSCSGARRSSGSGASAQCSHHTT